MTPKTLSLLAALMLTASASAQTTRWTQTADNVTVLPSQSAACELPGNFVSSGNNCGPGFPSTADNRFWRRFDRNAPAPLLATPPVIGDFEITQVNFGADCAAAGGGMLVRINVFNDTGPSPPYQNLGLLGYQDVLIPDTTLSVQNVPICPPIFVPGSATHVAIAIEPLPNQPVVQRFFIGANNAGQSDPSHLSSSACGITTPPMPPVMQPPIFHVIIDFVSRQPVGRTTWTQSFDSTVVNPGPDVVCVNPMSGEAADNSYWRLYDRSAPAEPFAGQPVPLLSNCPVADGFEITAVVFGVGRSLIPGGVRTGRVRVWEDLDGGPVPGPLGVLRLIGSREIQIFDSGPTLQTIVIDPPILVPDSVPVVALEVMIDQGGNFGIGYNNGGETPPDSSYISSSACGLDDPVPFGAIGFAAEHMILDFVSRPMAVGTTCVIPFDDPATPPGCGSPFVYPPTLCGYFLSEPLLIPQLHPVTLLPTGDVLRFDVILRGFSNVTEVCGGNLGGIRSTFDAIMELHVTVEGNGPAAGLIDRIIALRVTGGIIDSSPRPLGTTDFQTEVVSIVGEITQADMDRDFMNLRIELGTGTTTPTTSAGDVRLLAPPCVGTVGIGEVRMTGWRTNNEGMGHSPLQGSVSDPPADPTGVLLLRDEILPPPIESPGAVVDCTVQQVTNSTGRRGRIRAVGSGSVVAQNLLIVAEDLPLQTAYFIVSPQIGFIAQPGTSVGNLCLGGGSLGRYACTPATPVNRGGPCSPSQVGTGPTISIDIWTWGVPTPGTPGMFAQFPNPGDTFYWQCWHRDPPPGNVSNFTNVVGVSFY